LTKLRNFRIIQDEFFEWDDDKARRNLAKHKVSFEVARTAFADMNAMEEFDHEHSDDEDRWLRTAMTSGGVVVVSYVMRENRLRLISARKANQHEQQTYVSQSQ
jgi:uncharacterized protein